MDRKYRWEQLNEVFQSLPEDKRNQFHDAKEEDAEYQLFLSRILSELEAVKGGVIDQSEASNRTKKSCLEKMIRSATEKIGTPIEDCSEIAVMFIGAFGYTKLILSICEYIVEKNYEFDNKSDKFAELLGKMGDELGEVGDKLGKVGDVLRKVIDDLKVALASELKAFADGSQSL